MPTTYVPIVVAATDRDDAERPEYKLERVVLLPAEDTLEALGQPGSVLVPRKAPGLTIPPGWKLPSLLFMFTESVRWKSRLRANLGPDPSYPPEEVELWRSRPPASEALKLQLAWMYTFHDLYYFSIFVHLDDIPDKLVDAVIWMHQLRLKAIDETPEETLVAYQAECSLNLLQRETLYLRRRLATCLMQPKVERYHDALPVMKQLIAFHVELLKTNKSPHQNTPWKSCPALYAEYASTRVFTNHFDAETKSLLEKALQAIEDPNARLSPSLSWTLVTVRVNLSLVLQQLGVQPELQKQHTQWAANHIRKRPHLKPQLLPYLRRPDQPTHPVYTALGAAWFKDRPETEQEKKRAQRECSHCGIQEPLKKLSLCRGCGSAWYCSRECQRKDWPKHKHPCQALVQTRLQVEDLKLTSPIEGRVMEDLLKWNSSTHYANREAMAHSLGLHFDLSRGKTHIVIRILEHTPDTSGQIHRQFRVVRWGVYKVENVMDDMIALTGKTEQELQDGIEVMRHTHRARDREEDENIPLMHMTGMITVGTQGAHRVFHVCAKAVSEYHLRQFPHDPKWRQKVNVGDPPLPLTLPSGARDESR